MVFCPKSGLILSREISTPLTYPFEIGEIDWPAATARALFLGAQTGLRLPREFSAPLDMVQGFRPDFLALQKMGRSVAPEVQSDGYDLALILASRHRGENEMRLAQAIERVKPGGLVVMAGGKTEGISSLRKRLQKAVPLNGHLAKNHGEVFWFERSAEVTEWAKLVRTELQAAESVDGRFETAPGMFSHDRVDAGSRLLAESLPVDLKGEAADFCAGWGYLSAALVERALAIRSIDLYEADHASLEAARRNLARIALPIPSEFFWQDLTSEALDRRYHVIVMNPPFHQGRAAEPDLGQAMIRTAHKALKISGQLFVVANRGLPYDRTLKTVFRQVEELAADKTFRVWRAVR